MISEIDGGVVFIGLTVTLTPPWGYVLRGIVTLVGAVSEEVATVDDEVAEAIEIGVVPLAAFDGYAEVATDIDSRPLIITVLVFGPK